MNEEYRLPEGGKTDLSMLDHTVVKVEEIPENKKEPFDHSPADAYGNSTGGSSKDPFMVSIKQMLANVKDINDKLYIDENGEGNYNFNLDTRSFGPFTSRIDYEAKKQYGEVKF